MVDARLLNALPKPAAYSPWRGGNYSVAPGLRPLGTDFGNGEADRRPLLLDRDFDRYRENKLACCREARERHWTICGLQDRATIRAFRRLASELANAYPTCFSFTDDAFLSSLTGESVAIDANGALDHQRSSLPEFVDHPLEGLALQIPSDIAIVERIGREDRTTALHVCAPSGWAPEEKVGRSFFQVHQPVPGFDAVNAVANRMVSAMIERGPWIRFVWGVAFDAALNHHPGSATRGMRGDQFWVRTERQTTLGMPGDDTAIFIIHVQVTPGDTILCEPESRAALRSGLLSMSEEARRYKGVAADFERLIQLLAD